MELSESEVFKMTEALLKDRNIPYPSFVCNAIMAVSPFDLDRGILSLRHLTSDKYMNLSLTEDQRDCFVSFVKRLGE